MLFKHTASPAAKDGRISSQVNAKFYFVIKSCKKLKKKVHLIGVTEDVSVLYKRTHRHVVAINNSPVPIINTTGEKAS